MSDDSSDEEKTEQATPRRLDKAREEGQVVRSRELTTLLLLLGGLIGIWLMGAHVTDRMATVMQQAFVFERNQGFDTRVMLAHVRELAAHSLFASLPFFLLLCVVALGAPMLLGGWMMSAKSMTPQLSKLNPLKGLKRMFSSQILAELGKALAKSLLVGGVGIAFLLEHRGDLIALMSTSITQSLGRSMSLTIAACGVMILALTVVALIDMPYQIWSHGKKLRMTKDEVKREHKESEGDPQVKGRIRSQQQAMARNRMMSKVPEADVVITNPTHYAVALRYDQARMSAPRVIAKGAGPIAARIRDLGETHRVPQLEAPPLARALYRHVDLDQEIPGPLYAAVAEVLAWAMRLKQSRADDMTPPPHPEYLPVPEGMDPQSGKTETKA